MDKDKEQKLRQQYPLHWAVFRKDCEELMALLEDDSSDEFINRVDCRGRTPLMLAVTLGHADCTKALLEKGADASAQNAEMWSVSHEAICGGDAELLRLILKYRDYQRALRTNNATERLLRLLKQSDDFYVEMSWEFTSWLPFVSKMCPSDTYKIYKKGSDVRIDTTLIGFDKSTNWKRGNQSFIFRISETNQQPQLVVIDHDRKTATIQSMECDIADEISEYEPPVEAIYSRMTAPVETTFVDIDQIGFERSKRGGLLSWITSSDRFETVDGYECKVYNASNVEIVTKTRTEHLCKEDRERYKQEEQDNPLHKILKLVEKKQEYKEEMKRTGNDVYCGLTPCQYLDKDYAMLDRDIGHPKQVTRRSNSFKATLWLCDNYLLDLQDQILPIIDLMAVNNTHFARLKNFIQLQLPSGFPIKIEIPLFHVVSARITFSNINRPGAHVTPIPNSKVVIDANAFQVASDYRCLNGGDEIALDVIGGGGGGGSSTSPYNFTANGHLRTTTRRYIDDDELYLQFALEQSMRDQQHQQQQLCSSGSGSGSGFSASGSGSAESPFVMDVEMDDELALAIAESLRTLRDNNSANPSGANPSSSTSTVQQSTPPPLAIAEDELMSRVLRLSEKEEEERQRIEKEQEDELQRVLKLSLIEK